MTPDLRKCVEQIEGQLSIAQQELRRALDIAKDLTELFSPGAQLSEPSSVVDNGGSKDNSLDYKTLLDSIAQALLNKPQGDRFTYVPGTLADEIRQMRIDLTAARKALKLLDPEGKLQWMLESVSAPSTKALSPAAGLPSTSTEQATGTQPKDSF